MTVLTPARRAFAAAVRCDSHADALAASTGSPPDLIDLYRSNAAAWRAEGARLCAPHGRCWCGRPAGASGECAEHDDAPPSGPVVRDPATPGGVFGDLA